jgi:hypothetical protein
VEQGEPAVPLRLCQTGPVRLVATVAVPALGGPFRAAPAAPTMAVPVGASAVIPAPLPARTTAVTGQGPLKVDPRRPVLPVVMTFDRDPLVTMAAGEPGEFRPRDDPRPMSRPRRERVARSRKQQQESCRRDDASLHCCSSKVTIDHSHLPLPRGLYSGPSGRAPRKRESRSVQYRGNATEPFDDTVLPCSQQVGRCRRANGSWACQMGGWERVTGPGFPRPTDRARARQESFVTSPELYCSSRDIEGLALTQSSIADTWP